MVQRLLRSASRPYFEMLECWLCQGVLSDPYAEFMVEEDKVHASLERSQEITYMPTSPCQ